MQIMTETVLVSQVVADPRFQPRAGVPAAEVKRMAQAGKRNGYPSGWDPTLYDPIQVWDPQDQQAAVAAGTYGRKAVPLYVFAGFHRLALAQLCGVTEFAAQVYFDCTEAEIVSLAARSNTKTRPMDPVEEARVYRQAFDAGMSAEEVAGQHDRRSPSYYERRALISYLSPAMQADVANRVISVEYAEVIGQAAKDGSSPAMQAHLAGIALRTKVRVELFRRMVRAMVQRMQGVQIPQGNDSLGLLFSEEEITDKGMVAVGQIVEEASLLAGIRDGWDEIRLAGQRQLKRLQRASMTAPDTLAGLLARVDAFRAAADRAVGSVFGETTEAEGGNGSRAVRECRPILKWVGSKAQEAPQLVPLIRARMAPGGRYVDPFMGSGAVFFAMDPDQALLGDALEALIDLYNVVRDEPAKLNEAIQQLAWLGNDKETFLGIRAEDPPAGGIVAAARLIYINKTGFNGLYRTNKAGKCNVPWGGERTPKWPTLDELVRCSEILKKAWMKADDWSEMVALATAGDCLFIDPPYPGTFDGYAGQAAKVDQVQLAEALHQAYQRGAGVVVTLPDMADLAGLYQDWCDKLPLHRRTGVSCQGATRGVLDQVVWCSRIGNADTQS